MESVQDEIKTWLLTQQDWLQEAADKLLAQGELSDTDVLAVCGLLKTSQGQKVSKHRTFDMLSLAPVVVGDLRLSAISSVNGIENLAPREPLLLGDGNLVVIYGHNGSGKSSYTRILKKACGKPRATLLKANVFQTAPADMKCTISFQQGDKSESLEWAANSSPIDAIRAVDIFDSDEAGFYLTKENAAAYTPPLVSMFESLAVACDRVKAQLQLEQGALLSSLPALPPAYADTEPARRYGSLRADLNEAALQEVVAWTETQATELNMLIERLKVADPAAVARQKRTTKAQCAQIIDGLTKGIASFGTDGLSAVRLLHTAAETKRRIAAEAAQVGAAQLDGVGSVTWRALWDAAKTYSQTAYPGQEFPVTDDARCVLCHQELAANAQHRLRDFEKFVQSKLEVEAQSAELAYRIVLEELPSVPTEAQIQTQCEAAGLTDGGWVAHLITFWNQAKLARANLLTGEAEELAVPVEDADQAVAALHAYGDQLEAQVAQSDIDVQGFDRAKAAKDTLTLEAQHWIAQQADAVRKDIDRLKSVMAYEDWKTLASSRKVSLKAGEVAERVITQAYVARFNQELKLLGAARIQVQIVKTRTDRGRVLHQLRLKDAKDGKAGLDAVLSDGERRIIALAAFLADVANKPHSAPFIFDDPISSLDHDFEWGVAARLAALAQTRQVLVFTHRLSLYGAMDDVARKFGDKWKDQHLTQLCIEAYSGAAGHPVAQSVWSAKTETANNILLDRLNVAKKAGDAAGGEAYRALAQGICSDFRKLLERTVEDDLLFAVVKRHRRSVTTENKLSALSLIKPDDCQLIDELMTKYSCYEHSQSQEVPVFIPEESELLQDINSLKQWRKIFVARRKEALA